MAECFTGFFKLGQTLHCQDKESLHVLSHYELREVITEPKNSLGWDRPKDHPIPFSPCHGQGCPAPTQLTLTPAGDNTDPSEHRSELQMRSVPTQPMCLQEPPCTRPETPAVLLRNIPDVTYSNSQHGLGRKQWALGCYVLCLKVKHVELIEQQSHVGYTA